MCPSCCSSRLHVSVSPGECTTVLPRSSCEMSMVSDTTWERDCLRHQAQAIVMPASALTAIVKPFRRLRELHVQDIPLSPAEVAELREKLPCLEDLVHTPAGQYEEMVRPMVLSKDSDIVSFPCCVRFCAVCGKPV